MERERVEKPHFSVERSERTKASVEGGEMMVFYFRPRRERERERETRLKGHSAPRNKHKHLLIEVLNMKL